MNDELFAKAFPATEESIGFLRWHEFDCPKHGHYRKAECGFLGQVGEIDPECPQCCDERLHQKMIEQYHENEWKNRCELIGIPRRFNGYSLDDFECATTEQSRAVATCKAWTQCSFTNLLICGPPGTGKTHLLCAALREAVATNHTAKFVIEDDMFRMVKETYNGSKSAMTESQILDFFGDVDFLAIDDMGRSRWSADESGILMKIINRRYNNRKSTAISTNLPPRQIDINGQAVPGLEEYLGEAIMRRLEVEQRRIMATWPAYVE